MKNFTILSIIFLLFLTSDLLSLPRFALRSGSACGDCHFNPTGGELRSNRGWNMSRKGLPLMIPKDTIEMSNHLAPNITMGLDYRGQFLGSFGATAKRLDFQRMSASIYTGVELTEDMKIYGRYDFIQQIWEGFMVSSILPGNGYLKGGVFIPNYGIRIDDHTAYTRGGDLGFLVSPSEGLIYDPTYTEEGLEAGIGFADVAFLTASVGRPSSVYRPVIIPFLRADPTYTATLTIMPETEGFHFMIGGSAANFKKNNLLLTGIDNVWMYGGFAGFSAAGFTILGEFDAAKSYVRTDSNTTAIMVEASYRMMKGMDFVLRYDRFDPLTEKSNDDVSRVIVGFEIWPYPFVEVRPQFRIQMEHPEVQNNALVIQAHLFY